MAVEVAKVQTRELKFHYAYDRMDCVCAMCGRRRGNHYRSGEVLFCESGDIRARRLGSPPKFKDSGILASFDYSEHKEHVYGSYNSYTSGQLPHVNPNAAFRFKKNLKRKKELKQGAYNREYKPNRRR